MSGTIKKNKELRPENVTKGSKKKVWWICKQGHSYKANINNRYSNAAGCRLCSNQSSIPEIRLYTELKALLPDTQWRYKIDEQEVDVYIPSLRLGVEYDGYHWHKSKKADDLKKNNILSKIGITVIRIRAVGLQKIANRDIGTLSHELELSDVKALLTSIAIERGEFVDKASSYQNRTSFLAEDEFKRIIAYLPSPTPENSLAETNPDIAADWDYNKNFPLTPYNFLPNSNKSVH